MHARDLDALFAPLTIRGVRLRNRFVMPGMQRGFMDDGAPTPRMVEYLRRCAAGGTGLLISESTSVDHPSAYWQPVMGRLEARTLPAWRRVVEAVRGEGAAFLMQLWHPGAIRRVADGHPLARFPALSPSGLISNRIKSLAGPMFFDVNTLADAIHSMSPRAIVTTHRCGTKPSAKCHEMRTYTQLED